MKPVIVAVALVALGLAARGAIGARGNRSVERTIEGLATLRAPARLQPRSHTSTWLGTTLHLTRPMHSFTAIGSHSPQHENLAITQLEPRQVARLGDTVLRHVMTAFEYVQDIAWDTTLQRDGFTLRTATARYTPNTMNRPAWLAQAFDARSGVVVSYRVMQDAATRDQAIALVEAVMRSYTPTTELPLWFGALERELGSVRIRLPIELVDPFSWEFDESGASWLFFRRHRQWADDSELPEQAVAFTVFFAPGNAEQERAARLILERESREGLHAPAATGIAAHVGAEPTVTAVIHRVVERAEPAWLVLAVDAARGVAMSYRVWQRDATRDDAAGVVRRGLDSYRFDGDAERWFAPRAGR